MNSGAAPRPEGHLLKAAHRDRKLIGCLTGDLKNRGQAGTLVAARQELSVHTTREMTCNQAVVADGGSFEQPLHPLVAAHSLYLTSQFKVQGFESTIDIPNVSVTCISGQQDWRDAQGASSVL